VKDSDKPQAVGLAREFIAPGVHALFHRRTAKLLRENGIEVQPVNKLMEGRPHCIDHDQERRDPARDSTPRAA